jgi:predicted  nucleic acid-binding Zn-ribbon protein
MAKPTKPIVAKTTSSKAVKPVAKTVKKVEKKPVVKKVTAAKKESAKPVPAKVSVRKPSTRPTAKKAVPAKAAQKKVVPSKPVAKPVVKKAAATKQVAKISATAKPSHKPMVKKAVTAKPVAKPLVKKVVTAKPVAKPLVKKVVTAKPVAKPLVKKVVTAKPVAKPLVKKVVVTKPVAKPEVKKAGVAKPVVKPAEKKAVISKPVEKPVGKKVAVVKPAEKTKKGPVAPAGKKVGAAPREEPPQDPSDVTIEKKLIALYSLQQIDSQVDKIRIIRGELPLEVQDLEDEIAGLETRIENYLQENGALEKSVTEKKISIKDSQALIKKYEEQQMNVRNNREYDSLTKEIEIQSLEIQLSEKRIREFQQALEAKTEEINRFQSILSDRKNDLDIKKNELDDIVAETEKEENELIRNSEINRKYIEERLITAYTRIRKNARNGLAVVQIERDACGGCFNKIPPQHQLDIRMHKKIIVCEYCGRILVDDGIVNLVN